MKLLFLQVLIGLVLSQKESSWFEDFDPESAYLSIISLRRELESTNQTASLNDDEETSEDEDEILSPPPPSGRRPGPPRPPNRCGSWGSWEQAKCFWPSESLDKLPAACAAIPTKPEWPTWMKKFIVSKAMEKYNMLMDEYKSRGSPPKCGYCTRSFECRIRNDTTTAKRFCPMKEVRPLFQQDCEDKKACEVNQERGGCPPPLFLGGGRQERLQMMIRNGNHEGFSSELYKMRMMDDGSEGGRQKRQADSPAYDDSISFMPFQPQYDFPYEGKGGPSEFPSDNADGPRSGFRKEGRGRGGMKKGGRREGGRGGDRRGPGGRGDEDIRKPAQDAYPTQTGPAFGPMPFGGQGRPQGLSIGGGARPDFPFFPTNDEISGGFSSGRPMGGFPPRGPPPPMGSRPFGPHEDFPQPPSPPFGVNGPSFPAPFPFNGPPPPMGSRPFGPHEDFPQPPPPSFGVNGPSFPAPFPFNGPPMGDGRGPRMGRQTPFGQRPPGGPFQQKFQYGPGLSAAPRFAMFYNPRGRMSFPRDVPPMRFGPRPPFGPPPHHRFLMELFHGTTCASANGKCLCCCGHYIPNVETGACENLKQLLPGIDKMVENVDRENQPARGPAPPPPPFRRQMKKIPNEFIDF